MFKLLKKLISKQEQSYSLDSYDSDSYDSLDSYESSEISYDSDIDIHISNMYYKPYNPTCTKLNQVAELKRKLCLFNEYKESLYLVHALKYIEKIGFYPPGMPYKKYELADIVYKYADPVFIKYCINIAPYHKYLCEEDTHQKFELWAKSPFNDTDIYSKNVDEMGQTLLHHAVRWNNYELVKKLLRLEFDPNAIDDYGKTPIYGCVGKLHHFNSRMPYILLQYGANPYHKLYSGKTLLDKAIQKNNINLVILLVTKYGFEFGYRKHIFSNYPEWAQEKLIKHWLN